VNEPQSLAALHANDGTLVTASCGKRVQVQLQLCLQVGSVANFSPRPGQLSAVAVHRSVKGFWYVVAGHGRMWR
jgi:mannose-6-phosphate isomerase-like protein (cupin superfamily)